MRRALPYIILLINALIFQQASAQDIFDLKHSKLYAEYLLKQKNYTAAADEWEHVLSLENTDSNKLILLRTYRLAGFLSEGENFASKHFSEQAYMGTRAFSEEYLKTLLLNNSLGKAKQFLSNKNNGLDTFRSADYTFQAYLLQSNWADARKLYNENKTLYAHKDNSYQSLLLRAENMPHKNPALATTLSAVVPGLGKVYADDWKDGAVAFLFVGSSALQSYWGFHEKGTRSVYGWIFGGLALGYYTGNVYGSYKAAKRFNYRQQELILRDAKRIIFSAY